MSRDKRIALDYAAGVPAVEIAWREGISPPRVYQIAEKIRQDCRLPRHTSKEELGLVLFRRVAGECQYEDEPSTPAEFYWQGLMGRTTKS